MERTVIVLSHEPLVGEVKLSRVRAPSVLVRLVLGEEKR